MSDRMDVLLSLLKVLALGCVLIETANGLQCLNPAGKPVDWFVVYKIPQIGEDQHPLIKDGLGHFYLDVNSPQWQLSNVPVDQSGQAIYNTLKQIYSPADEIAYAMYNDKTPEEKVDPKKGHTKGVIGFDKSSGFWLVHSTPQFPPVQSDGYSWPKSGRVNGQTFLCVTYSYNSLDTIGTQFHYNFPLVYDYNLPDSFRGDNPKMTAYLTSKKKPRPKLPPWKHLSTMKSLGGVHFLSFAKFSKLNEDLYSTWVAPYFQSDLLTETWQNGPGKLPSNCTANQFKVYNIVELSFPDKVTFKQTKDHSKWAVTRGNSPPWICIGDINRQNGQMKRAGGTVCFKNDKVHAAFTKAVSSYEKCG